jgi:hypothetical protein
MSQPIAGIWSAFEEGKYTDFTIKCKGKDFRVHRVVLGTQSSYFNALFKAGFKVRDSK